MPLLTRDRRNLQEQPLSRLVFHRRLLELDFHGVVGMANDLEDLSLSSCSDLSVDPLDQVDSSSEKLPPPALVAYAMGPELLASERREGLRRVSHEAACCMGVHAQQERDEQVVRVPERLERLTSYAIMSGRVHQEHAQKHDMPGDAASLGVVYLHRGLWSDLVALNIEEVDVVSRYVNNSEDQHRIGDLSVEPLRLVQWKPSDIRS